MMNAEHPAEAVLEPLGVDADRLYRMRPEVFEGLVEHGLITPDDKVALVDGVLVHEGADLETRLYRIPLDVYEGIARFGLLTRRDKVVFLDGILVKTMTKNERHTAATFLVYEAIRGQTPRGWHVRTEAPLTLPSGPSGFPSVPEPDVSLVRGSIRDYLVRHPLAGDCALVVEVTDSTLRKDRKALARYAWVNIPVVWIVNLNDRVVEEYSGPTGPTTPAAYTKTETYGPDDHVPVLVDGREAGRVAVVDLLP